MTQASSKSVFLGSYGPVILLGIVLFVEGLYFGSLASSITSSPSNHSADILNVVRKYSASFRPSDVNASNYGVISQAVVQTAASILGTIQIQIFYSDAAILLLGLLFAVRNARVLPPIYNKTGQGNVKSQQWLSSGASISTAISGAVSVVVALVGAVSLLSPGVVGGYVLAALQALLLCVIFGIMVQSLGADVIMSVDQQNSKVTLDPSRGSLWEAATSIQFVLLVSGIGLLLFQVLLL